TVNVDERSAPATLSRVITAPYNVRFRSLGVASSAVVLGRLAPLVAVYDPPAADARRRPVVFLALCRSIGQTEPTLPFILDQLRGGDNPGNNWQFLPTRCDEREH